jgi:hypothetical protein
MKTATALNQNARCLSNLNCEVHTLLVEDGRCTCFVVASVPKSGSTATRPKQRYTMMSDADCKYYLIPTEREAEFEACDGKDFDDYLCPQGAMIDVIFSRSSVN